jgi:aminopeptidase N
LQALRAQRAPLLSRVRTAILTALGEYRAPQQAELAARSAQALADTLERGDISYKVEVAAAESLGATRDDGVVDRLVAGFECHCWNYVLQCGIFRGLAATGEGRVVEIMASHLTNVSLHPQLRAAASAGLEALAHNRHLYAPETRQQAVTALCSALEHDSWAPVRASAARALQELGEKRALDLLERTAGHELDSRAQRIMRVAAQALRSGDSADARLQQLRLDLDQLRAENRQLKEQLNSLEARLT